MNTNNDQNSTEQSGRKPYDLTTIYAISDNNPEFFKKLLLVFAENITDDMNAMKAARQQQNWAEVGLIAHKIKPSSMHFGITSITDNLRALENRNNSPEKANQLISDVDEVVNLVLNGLKAEFPDIFL